MTDTPTSRMGLRQMSQGSRVNTWGDDSLNEVMRVVDRSAKGVQTLAITGDTTLSWTSYVATNDGQCAVLLLTGSLSSAANLVVPSREWQWDLIKNSTGQTITVKTSAGTGIAIPNGRQASVFCDASDCYFAVPNYLGTGITEQNDRDIADRDYVDTTVANATTPATAGTFRVSGGDTTAGYASQKFTAQISTTTTTQLGGLTSLQFSIQDAGGDEKLKATIGAPYVGGFLDGGSKTAGFTPSQGTAYDVDCTSDAVTVQLSSMTSVQLGQEIKINKFGTNNVVFVGTVNGAANLTRGDNFNAEMRYCGASWGWNLMAGAVKSIQKGTISLAGVASNTATITSVTTSKSVVFHNGQAFGTTTGLNAALAYVALTDATTVTATRVDTTNTLTVAFTVVEYY